MKKFTTFLFAFVVATLTGCDTNDDGFYNETYVSIPNLVEIDVQPVYQPGDYLYVDADFSRYLDEAGESLPLDLYQSTNGAESFSFTYVLEKQSGDEWTPVDFTANAIDVQQGSVESGAFVYAHAVYNIANERYEYRAGLPLASAGTYRLSFGYNSTSPDEVELRSDSVGNSLFVNIGSEIGHLDQQGFYNFTVE